MVRDDYYRTDDDDTYEQAMKSAYYNYKESSPDRLFDVLENLELD